ncbi:hypothetical protein ELI20_01240 [Rhizobium ruizarguesonis]|uniref:hypothetical protein n=1 Tax=Rhizobium ruizarguesonis TaxID=2081791 RepID=UPI00102F59E7|nr:hypothetical protein [Rhizobium ruizarguesonis]TAU29793.1 hypothetical protein ELI47_01125 [Rhizobium ruizarguesonis]TAW19941.1 hypothetical protein ELI20_01240 [Rhizobium ruizarguesonis]
MRFISLSTIEGFTGLQDRNLMADIEEIGPTIRAASLLCAKNGAELDDVASRLKEDTAGVELCAARVEARRSLQALCDMSGSPSFGF